MNHFYKYHFETTVLNEDSVNSKEDLAVFGKTAKRGFFFYKLMETVLMPVSNHLS